MFYRPNTMRAEELSRNPVANALAVTFLMVSEQVPSTPPLKRCSVSSVTLMLAPSHPCHCISLSSTACQSCRRLLRGQRCLKQSPGGTAGLPTAERQQASASSAMGECGGWVGCRLPATW